jgi:hypothetical protein
MNPLIAFFHAKPGRWDGCRQPSAAERMARYSNRHAEDAQRRENAGAAAPLQDGHQVIVADLARLNRLPNQRADETRAEYEARMAELRAKRLAGWAAAEAER